MEIANAHHNNQLGPSNWVRFQMISYAEQCLARFVHPDVALGAVETCIKKSTPDILELLSHLHAQSNGLE